MKQSRFIWQLYGAFALLILVTTITFGFAVERQYRTDYLNHTRTTLEKNAYLLREIIRPYYANQLQVPSDTLNDLAGLTGNRITLVDAAGGVQGDSERDPSEMDNHLTRPEFISATTSGFGSSERYSDTLNKMMMYLSVRIEVAGSLRGYVRVSLPLGSINQKLAELRNSIIVAALVIGLLALLMGYLLAARFTRPLEEMTLVATRMAEGDYSQRLSQVRKDEIGRLSRALNVLASSSEDRIETIVRDRNQLAGILSSLVEGVIAVDTEQRIIHMNGAAGRLLKVDEIRSVGKLLWEVLRVSDLIQYTDLAIRNQVVTHKQIEFSGRTIELSIVPLRDSEARPSGAITVLQDVTEQLRVERMKTDFVANASHELKTPITAIRALSETLIDDDAMRQKDRRHFTKRVRKQALRLGRIVDDLLQLSRFDSNISQIDANRVDLSQLVCEVGQSYQQNSDNERINLTLDVEDDIYVSCDEKAMVQLISNLVDNAIKYTPGQGKVTVSLNCKARKVCLTVTDDGIGIPRHEQARVFERFYRVDKARSEELGGTGLGLSIVKHIVQAHGGTVDLISELGEGSSFTVTLPVLT